ncbi:MAG: hypothetical protein IPM82_16285 [Saprospiraceae bacterium]|nr:hypothetical protein [Saprospiraceae bacterium]
METTHPRISSIRPLSHDFWLNMLTCTVAGAVVSIFFQKSYGSCGDYPQHFQACWWGVGIGAAVGLLFNFGNGQIPYAWRMRPVLTGLPRYFLAWTMLSYAVVKIIPTQFPDLLANLDSTFAELTPMRVAWTFFGYSEGYQMLLGWAEAVPALLLLFRRTSLLGAILMAPVLVNVVAVNIFFDVCVKLNSSIYLGISIFLIVIEFDRLWAFFIAEKAVPPPVRQPLFSTPKARRIARILNGLLVAGILGYTAFNGWEAWQYLQGQRIKTPVSGAWQVEKMERLQGQTWATVPTSDSLSLERVYFQGILGVFKGPVRRDRMMMEIDSARQELLVTFMTAHNERPQALTWQYQQPDSLRLTLTGKLWVDSVRLECVRRGELR